MVAEPAKEFWIPSWNGDASSLERYEEDVLIFLHSTPEDKRTTVGPRLLSQFPTGSPQRSCGLSLLKSGVLVQKDGAEKLIEAPETAPRKGHPTGRQRALQTLPVPFLSAVSTINAALHC